MVRAAVEEGLEHHKPETLNELMRTGVYKDSQEKARLDLEEKKVTSRQERLLLVSRNRFKSAGRSHKADGVILVCVRIVRDAGIRAQQL